MLRPSLGAYFASRPLPLTSTVDEDKWNVYAAPAAIALVLLVAETVFLTFRLPETIGWQKEDHSGDDIVKKEAKPAMRETADKRIARLSAIGQLHGLFLLFFSGVSEVVAKLMAGFTDRTRLSSPSLSLHTTYSPPRMPRTVDYYLARSVSSHPPLS